MNEVADRLPPKLGDLVDLCVGDWRKIDREAYWPKRPLNEHTIRVRDGVCTVRDSDAIMIGSLGVTFKPLVDNSMGSICVHCGTGPDEVFGMSLISDNDRRALHAMDIVGEGSYRDAVLWASSRSDYAPKPDIRRIDFLRVPIANIHYSWWGHIHARLGDVAYPNPRKATLGDVAAAFRRLSL